MRYIGFIGFIRFIGFMGFTEFLGFIGFVGFRFSVLGKPQTFAMCMWFFSNSSTHVCWPSALVLNPKTQ